MTKRLMFVLAIFFSLSIISCEKYVIKYPEIDTTVQIDFVTEILPILTNDCAPCHSGGIAPNLSEANAYTSLLDGGYIDIENPELSSLYIKLNPAGTHNSVPSQANLDKILVWIQQGAKDKVEKIDFVTEIMPIFAADCISCHSGSRAPDLTQGNAYASLIAGNYVDLLNPESSILYTKLLPSGTHNGRTNQANVANILKWIQQGAKETTD